MYTALLKFQGLESKVVHKDSQHISNREEPQTYIDCTGNLQVIIQFFTGNSHRSLNSYYFHRYGESMDQRKPSFHLRTRQNFTVEIVTSSNIIIQEKREKKLSLGFGLGRRAFRKREHQR